MNKKVVIVDYQIGNIFSVQHACGRVGLNSKVSSEARDIDSSDALILPGVGAFSQAMKNINELKLSNAIRDAVKSGKPIFGICLGLQLLFTRSSEFESSNGLNLIQGNVKKIKKHPTVRIPHTGWNTINKPEKISWANTVLEKCSERDYFYFVHSFVARPRDNARMLSTTSYGDSEYCSAVIKDNIVATQFHPEKSGKIGLKIFSQWGKINKLI